MNEEKEIIEIKQTEILPDEPIVKEVVNKKPKFKFSFKNMTKKQKIIILIISVLLLLCVGLLVFYFLTKNSNETPKEEPIVIEKDNYRYKDGSLYFLNANDEEIGSYECINKSEFNCMVAYFSNEDNFNQTIYKYEDETDVLIRSFVYNDNFVFVFDNEKLDTEEVKLYNIEKKEVIDTYKLVKKGEENNVILKNSEDNYGLISFATEIEEKLPFTYKYLGKIANKENFVFENEKGKGIINLDKKVLTSKIKLEIVDYNDKYIVTKNENSYLLIDYKGNELSLKYDFIGIKEKYIAFVLENLLYIKDENLNKINEEGLKLENNKYNLVYYFNKDDGKKIDEERAFLLKEENEELIVDINQELKKYNIYEPLINAKNNYINYLDGVIYVYHDLAKNELMGKYKCSNKNIVKKDTVNFENCFVAKETKLLNRLDSGKNPGFIPIYNNRFIFVNDQKNLTVNNNIVLWDLIEQKSLANYASVDVGYYNDENIALADAGNLLIMAQNANKEYGMIKMNLSTVSGIIPFKASSIVYFNNNFLVKKTDGTYHLHSEDGTELTNPNSSIKNEIIDYKSNGYLVVKDPSEKYLVYSLTGTIVSNQLKYVKLGNSFYAGVNDNNELEVYSYDNPKTNILLEKISIVKTSDYKNSFDFTDSLTTINLKVYKTAEEFDVYKFDNTGKEIIS